MIDPEALYVALLNDPSRLRDLPRLQIRCHVARCLLLDAIDLGEGRVLLHQQRYKLSPTRNEARSSAAGRARNTEDGDRRWHARTYWIDTSALALDDSAGATLGMQCDHMDKQLRPSEFRSMRHKGHAEVTARADGSFTSVR